MADQKKKTASTPDEFIALFAPDVQEILQKIRQVIQENAPQATQKMGYGVPGFYFKGPLVYYAAFTSHVGIYPGSEAIEVFKDDLAGYKTAKGTIQFPLDKPIPYDLIARIVRFRVEQNQKKE